MNAAQAQLKEGLVLGSRYQIEELLGIGDTGDVYSCRDIRGSNARLALKALRITASDPGRISSSSREFSLLQRLRHPNLVRILDFGVVEGSGVPFLVEEWIDGRDICSGTEGMDTDDALGLIVELSKTLQYLHARGIVHGNLKPSNAILLGTEEGRARIKLLDFGLTRWARGTWQQDGNGMLAYMAPEIHLGACPNLSSDLYSLGILIYQLLARHLPFDDEDPGFLIQKHLQGSVDLRPIERLRNGGNLSLLVSSLLQKDPAKRISSGEIVIGLISEVFGRNCTGSEVRELESHFSASQFVGREKEMSFLQESASRVRESGRGWTVFITGEAGSGKTRCMEELRSWGLLEGWRVVEGACGAHEEAAYEPYRQILAGTEPANGQAIFRFAKLSRTAESETLDSSSDFAAGQFRDLLTRELVRRLTDQPTMLFLHDFHQADEATSTVLDYLSSDIRAHPVLICVSLRSGEESKGILERVVDPAQRQERGETLALEPLAEESVKQLLAGMTGDGELKETLGKWLFRSVGGNPFFLEEMLKHLIEQGVLHPELGKWRFIKKDLKKLEIPANVGVVLKRRLAQLSQSALEVVNWLALFHHAVSKKLLSEVMLRSSDALAEALQELNHRQMIRVGRREAEETVDFSHALISEVIRKGLPQRVRRRMHRKIAEVLEREYGVDSHLQEIAMHHIEGKSKAASVRYVLASASQSRAEYAHENALRCFEHVFKIRGDLANEELCAAAIEASDTMFALGLPKRAIRLLKTEMCKNKTIGADLKARMLMQLALSYQYLGDLHMQEMCCKRGLRFFRNRPDTETSMTKAMLWAELAFGAILQSRPRQGLAYLDRALKSCPSQNADTLAGRIQGLSASLHRVACNLHEALAASRRAAAILYRSGESYQACYAYSTLGGILTALGRFPHSLEVHRQAVALSDKSRSVIPRSQALGNLAECLCRMGRVQEALNTTELAAKAVFESNNPSISYAFNTILAEVRLAAGDYRSAHQLVDKIVQNCEHNRALLTFGHAHYVAANLNFILGNFPDALNHIEQLCAIETRDAPFYEHELAEALRTRILFERGSIQNAVIRLQSLDRAVTKKHWPYQMCIIRLHLCEILIKQQRLETAEKYAKNALRLAKAMQSIPLISHCRLLLGLIYSPLRRTKEFAGSSPAESLPREGPFAERAIGELHECCKISEARCHTELIWRAHAELCLIFGSLARTDHCLAHAKKAYELLCKLEDQIPSEMLPAFCSAFDRSRTKLELARLIESIREKEHQENLATVQIHDSESARKLLRVSAAVNSVRELDPLLEIILDQLIPAIDAERALIYLRNKSAGKLELAKGRKGSRESLLEVEATSRSIVETVYREAMPIISANAQNDPRMNNKEWMIPGISGKLLCAPLKASGRVIGVLYSDHSSPVESLGESTINLFAAFCNLAAIAVDKTLAHQYLEREKAALEPFLPRAGEIYPEIVGASSSIKALKARIRLAAASPLDILIMGESGTGKELVARAIHRTGRRKSGKFVAVDCGSLSDSLAEAELFGYRKGAFTGAAENRHGLLEAADGGMVFLDEISNLPFRLQAKLLRVLQEREVRRIGETTPRKIDIQIIAATNKDLLGEIKNGRFRRDLFYRLKAMEIRVPPLREHSEDIPLLIEWFLQKTAESEEGRFKKLLPEAMDLLKGYFYPGNIRELKNIIASAYYSTAGTSIRPEELPPEVHLGSTGMTGSESQTAGQLYLNILKGKGTFEELVKKPFLQRHFTASLVRKVIQKALEDAGGRYRDAFARLRIPDPSYSVMIQFLKRNKCYVDFRPFRRDRGKASSRQ